MGTIDYFFWLCNSVNKLKISKQLNNKSNCLLWHTTAQGKGVHKVMHHYNQCRSSSHWCNQKNNHVHSCRCGGRSGQTSFDVQCWWLECKQFITLLVVSALIWLHCLIVAWRAIQSKGATPVAKQIPLKCWRVSTSATGNENSPETERIPSYRSYVRQSYLVKIQNRVLGDIERQTCLYFGNFMKSV